MTRSDCIQTLLQRYERRREQNEVEQQRRIDEAERLSPRLTELRLENSRLPLETMRKIFALTDPDQKRQAAEEMKLKGQQNNAKIRAELKKLGLPEDYLQLHYHCPLCRDSGKIGDPPHTRFCDCFEAELHTLLSEDGSMADSTQQCFETFDASRFPEKDGQRKQIQDVRRVCEKYADSFPNTDFRNILLTGSGGLGKTFLLNCVWARVLARRKTAVRLTAFRMFEIMRRAHMDPSASGEFDMLIETPLLLIDDLGSEPMMRNITIEYLFSLLNERMAAGRHTFVATNLDPLQLQQHYGERVASRLLDRSCCAAMRLTGSDLRHIKN